MQKFAVLLMAYGTPSSEADIEAYLTDIRGGRRPTPEAVQDLRERYRKIGGRSPLLEITNAQTSALEKRLNTNGMNVRTYFGMKHWHPYIREVVPTVLEEGLDRIVGLVLAPHYSQISIGGYKKALDNALGVLERKPELTFIQSWYDNQIFHRAVEEKIQGALATLPNKAEVLFTAHSLPERILQQNDPYPNQLLESCRAVAQDLKLERWSFAYQSAGQTNEKWLGPDILDALEEIRLRGGTTVLVVPIGFVADHLEILYDIDVEAKEFANEHGLNLHRTESLNTSPTLILALAEIVSARAALFNWR